MKVDSSIYANNVYEFSLPKISEETLLLGKRAISLGINNNIQVKEVKEYEHNLKVYNAFSSFTDNGFIILDSKKSLEELKQYLGLKSLKYYYYNGNVDDKLLTTVEFIQKQMDEKYSNSIIFYVKEIDGMVEAISFEGVSKDIHTLAIKFL